MPNSNLPISRTVMPVFYTGFTIVWLNSSSLARQTTAITLDTPKNIQPPEALTGGKIDSSSDIWALGCTVSFNPHPRTHAQSMMLELTRHTCSLLESHSLTNPTSHRPSKSHKKRLASSKVSSLKVGTSQRKISPRLQSSSECAFLSRLRIGRRHLSCWKVVGFMSPGVLVGGAVFDLPGCGFCF